MLALSWLALGGAMVAVPVWLGWTRWSVLLNGHPLTLAVTMLCALGGVVALAWAVATLLLGARFDREAAPGQLRYRTDEELRRRSRWRLILAIPALVVSLVTVSLLAYSRPYPVSEAGLAAMRSSADVRVLDRLTWFELQSARRDRAGRELKPTTGLIFYPGARVDARAYAKVLQPLARAGYLVVVLKEPFGLGVLGVNRAGLVIESHGGVAHWAVGGHSLGGVAAASFADTHAPEVKGLLLYASYPAGRLERTDLKVMSISGSADGLATPAEVESRKEDLPASTQYVVVRGGVHAFFGDYGPQSGDGVPSVTQAAAQAQIARSSQALLASLVPPRKK